MNVTQVYLINELVIDKNCYCKQTQRKNVMNNISTHFNNRILTSKYKVYGYIKIY